MDRLHYQIGPVERKVRILVAMRREAGSPSAGPAAAWVSMGRWPMNQEGRASDPIVGQELREPETTAAPLTDEERFTEPEWLEWFALTPQERWAESEKLWAHYLEIGGRLEPEPDTQSPFFDPGAQGAELADGWTGLRAIRRSGV